MAGKNQVTLTFAGDSRSLEQTLSKVESGAKETESALERMSKSAGDSVDRVSSSSSRIHKVVGEGGRAFGEYGKGLGGVGDRMDELDTRAMGAADGFAGLTDAMKWNKLTAQEQAMVFSDLGSTAYNFVIPTLQDAGKKVANLTTKLGGLKNAAMLAGGVAGLAAVGVGLVALSNAQHEEAISNATDAFVELDGQVNTNSKSMVYAAQQTGNLDDMMGRIIESSPQVAFNILENADALGITSEEADRYRGELEKVFTAQDNVAASIRDTTEAMRAQSDPFFALIDADQQMASASQAVADAENAVIEARKEHGANSAEVLTAVQNLTAARLTEGEALYGQEAAVRELAASMLESGTSVDDVITHLSALARQGGVSQETVDAVSDALRGVPRRTEATLAAHDVASRAIDGVSVGLAALNGDQATVTIHANVTNAANRALEILRSAMFADGGIVPQYLASGGFGGRRGTDTIPAMLTPGEMVLNDQQQAALWAMANGHGVSGGGGPTINVYVSGSVLSNRELVGVIHDELRRGGFSGLAA